MKSVSVHINSKILFLREQQIVLDYVLATLYGVETRVLKQAVRRNLDRFPKDFMFVLTPKEVADLVSQNVIPSKGILGGALPFAFTEHGVTMLSAVLRTPKAVAISLQVVRAFIALKQHALNYEALAQAIAKLEGETNQRFAEVGEVLDALLEQKRQQEAFANRKRIGYK